MSISWLLFKKSVHQNWKRLALTSGATVLGVLLLLSFTAAFNGIVSAGYRDWWKETIFNLQHEASDTATPPKVIPGKDALYAQLFMPGNLARWQDKTIWVTSLYANGPSAPTIGNMKTPAPGEYYVSPELKRVIDKHSDQQINNRFGTTYKGVIPESHVSAPNALEVIRGTEKASLNAVPIYELHAPTASDKSRSQLILNIIYMGIFILIFPVMLFIAIATQLGSAQREQRYAALRLIGATKSQITRIIATESLMATAVGIAIGLVSYLLLLPLIQQNFVLQGNKFWPETVVVKPVQYAIIIVGTLLFTLFANWWGMRKVRTSPLGVARKQRVEKKTRWWRVIPLLVGIGVILFVRFSSKKDQASEVTVMLFFAGIVLIMIGLVVVGPWLTRVITQIIAKRTNNATVLLGTKYIAAHSTRVFRSVSGVVIALFAGSFYLTAVSGVADLSAQSVKDNGLSRLKNDAVYIQADAMPNGFEQKLKQLPYIASVDSSDVVAENLNVLTCDAMLRYTRSTCPSGANFASVNFNGSGVEKPIADTTHEGLLQQLREKKSAATDTPAQKSYLVTMRDSESFEKLRSFIAVEYRNAPSTRVFANLGSDAQKPKISPLISELATAAYFGMAFTVLVAIASLAVSTIGGLLERQRTLLTLRLGGMEVHRMERMVVIESLIPLIVTSLLASIVGVSVGYIFMQIVSASLDAKLSPLYFAIMVGTITLSIIAIYLILPMIKTITELENNRTE